MPTPSFRTLSISLLFIFFGTQALSTPIRTYLPHSEVCPDVVFEFPVFFEELFGVDSFNLVLDYDASVLTYRGFENIHPELFTQGDFTISHVTGQITINYFAGFPIALGTDTLVTFRFEPLTGSSDIVWDLSESGYFFEGESVSSVFEDGSVSIFPEVEISLTQIPEEVCPGSFDASVVATVSGGAPPYEYQWIGSPIQVLSDSIARNLAADGGYTLRITDANGCVKDTLFQVKTRILNEVEISATPDTVYLTNPVVTFTAENLSDPFITNYLWRFGDGDSISTTDATVPHLYWNAKEFAEEGGQEYEVVLTVTNEYGCDTTIIYTIPVREAPVFIPNVFTPNGDGANDEFKIVRDDDKTKVIREEYLRLELVVFNRWGRKIFSSDDYRSDWDGGNAPDGAYFYVLNAIGFYKIDTYRGVVHILR